MTAGTLYGVGLGPGDPDLLSLRAHRLLGATAHVAYFRKAGRLGQARRIAEGLLDPQACEFAMEYPVTTEIPLSDPRYNEILGAFYTECTTHLLGLLRAGQDVVEARGAHALRRLRGPVLVAVHGLLGQEAVGDELERVADPGREQRAAVLVSGSRDRLHVIRLDEASGGIMDEDHVHVVRRGFDAGADRVRSLRAALDQRAYRPAVRLEGGLHGAAIRFPDHHHQLVHGGGREQRRGGAREDGPAAEFAQGL